MSIAEVGRELNIATSVDGFRQPTGDRSIVVESLIRRGAAEPIVFVNEPQSGNPGEISRSIVGCVLGTESSRILVFTSGELAVAKPTSGDNNKVLDFKEYFHGGIRIFGRNFEGDEAAAVTEYSTPGSYQLNGLPFKIEQGHNATHSTIDMKTRHGLIFEALRVKKK